MNGVTFSDVCKVFHSHFSTWKMSEVSRRLLGLIIKQDCVRNTKGNPYHFEDKELIEFYKGEADFYHNIKNAAKNPKVIEVARFNFVDLYGKFHDDEDYEKKDFLSRLQNLVKKDRKMDGVLKKQLLNSDIKQFYNTVCDIILYSITNNNKTNPKPEKSKKIVPVETIQERIIKEIKKLPKPLKIDVPSEINVEEMVYVSAILEAFSEDAGVQISSEGELLAKEEYSKYKSQLDRYRQDYFNAESIKESLKDTIISGETNTFESIENQTYDAIIDKLDEDYVTSYKRMTSVLTHVTTIKLASLLDSIPGWIGPSEKKGVCHILVNQGMIEWKK